MINKTRLRPFLQAVWVFLRPISGPALLAALALQVPTHQAAWAQEAPHLEKPPLLEKYVPSEAQTPGLLLDSRLPGATGRDRQSRWSATLPPFFRDTRLILSPRLFLFHRDNFDRSLRTAWAGGGSLEYRSGYFMERMAVGAVGYTSNGLYSPRERDGTMLLKPGQRNIYVLGQLYGEIKVKDGLVINLFRKAYDTPYINRSDTRMIPNTFEAYTITAKYGNLRQGRWEWSWNGGYFTRIKCKDSSSFIPMSQAAGVRSERGVGMVSGTFTAANFALEMFYYHSPDLITIFYTESRVNWAGPLGLAWQLGGQFSNQASTGDNLLRQRPFGTRQFGLKGDLSCRGTVLTLAYTSNAIGGIDLHSFWGTYPGFTSVQVRDFNRAGEKALMVKGTYDFSRLGLEGAQVFVRWVRGWNRVNPVSRKPLINEDEVDVDVQWGPKRGLLENLSFRVRCARVLQRGGRNDTLDDIRVIVNYRFQVL